MSAFAAAVLAAQIRRDRAPQTAPPVPQPRRRAECAVGGASVEAVDWPSLIHREVRELATLADHLYGMQALEPYESEVAEVAFVRLDDLRWLLADYVLESHKPHDMDSMALRFLDEKTIKFEDVAGKGAKQIGFDEVDIARASEYSAEDADVTLRLHHEIWPQVAQDDKLRYVYEKLELPTREVLVRIERNGVLIDAALLQKQSHDLGLQVNALEQKAYEAAGQPFNLGSPKQLGEILFGKLGLPVKRKTATGQPSTDEEVLTELADDYPLPKLILEHRSLSKLKSTYTDKLPKMVNPHTGRVHTNYGQATAITGRLSSNDPNLQNIPVRTPQGREIRKAFVPGEDGWVILEWNSKNFKKTWDAEQPTLQEELQLQTRTLTRQVIKVGTAGRTFGRVRRKLAAATDGDRQMVDILTAVLSDGLGAVEAACAEALSQGVHSADVVLNILARQRERARNQAPPPARFPARRAADHHAAQRQRARAGGQRRHRAPRKLGLSGGES